LYERKYVLLYLTTVDVLLLSPVSVHALPCSRFVTSLHHDLYFTDRCMAIVWCAVREHSVALHRVTPAVQHGECRALCCRHTVRIYWSCLTMARFTCIAIRMLWQHRHCNVCPLNRNICRSNSYCRRRCKSRTVLMTVTDSRLPLRNQFKRLSVK
jgi:hypothetical protein